MAASSKCALGLWLGAVMLIPSVVRGGERPVATAPATEARIDAVAARLRAHVLDPRPEAGQVVTRAVRRGLPPAVLAVVLDVLREHPRADLLPVVRELACDRRVEIRGRAFVAWAALGGVQAQASIEAAADDLDPRLRRLAWVLATQHPSEAAERTVQALLARDAALAELAGPAVVASRGAAQ